MKKYFLFLFILCIDAPLFCQLEAELNWSETMPFKGRSEFISVVGARDSMIYVLSSSSSAPEYSIEVDLQIYHSRTLQLLREFTIIDNKSDQNFEKLVLMDEGIFVFTSFYDRKLGFKILTVSPYDQQKNRLGEMMRADEVFSAEKGEGRSFRITTSSDKKNVLVYHEGASAAGNKIFNMKVLNGDFTTMWEKEIELNYKERMVTLEDLTLADNLTVYLLTTMNPYGLKKSTGFGSLLNLKNSLFIYRPYEDKLKEFEFAMTRNWIGSVKMKLDNDNNVLASAYFTLPNDYKIRGFVIFRIDGSTGLSLMKKMVTFSKDELKKVDEAIARLKEYSRIMVGSLSAYPGMSSHMNTTSTEFELKHVFTSDNKMVIAVEALRRDERCTESINDRQMLVSCEKHFFYGDIMLFFINESGELTEIRNIDKMQHALENKNPYFSFSGTEDGHRFFLFYNDDSRNLVREEEAINNADKVPLMRMSRAILKIQAFAFDGKVLAMNVTETNGENAFYFPAESKFIGSSQLLLYSQKEKNYKFGKLLIR